MKKGYAYAPVIESALGWIRSVPPMAEGAPWVGHPALRDDYCKSVASIDWADRLAPKSLRFVVMTGLSAAAGILMTPAAGVAAGIGLSATDYFLLDRLIKGWKPNQFVEGALKHFVEKPPS